LLRVVEVVVVQAQLVETVLQLLLVMEEMA
jgi:hypothetical protein